MIACQSWSRDQIVLKPDNLFGEAPGNTKGTTLVGAVFLTYMLGHFPEAAGWITAPQGSLQATHIHVTGQQT